MRVARWGNSLAVRLPRSVVEVLNLREGDSVEIRVMGLRSFEVSKAPAPKELLARLRKYRGRLPPTSSSTGSKLINVADAFFDTNILLYLLSKDARKASRAEELLASGGVVSVQVLNEFVAVGIRKHALQISEAREILGTIRTLCKVTPVVIETHDLALDLAEERRFSIYDALIVAAALLAKCTVLYTEDLQHGQRIKTVVVANPFLGQLR